MKLNELIKRLTAAHELYGDLDCWMEDAEESEFLLTDIACVECDDDKDYLLLTPYKIKFPLRAVK